MNYSRFGAICGVESAKAPLCSHRETGMWRHCLRPKKVAFRTFRVRKSTSNVVLLYMKDLQMCAYCPVSRHVPYFIIQCQRVKLNVDFRGKSVRWSQTPSPLAYAVYAFINVDNCERPLMNLYNTVDLIRVGFYCSRQDFLNSCSLNQANCSCCQCLNIARHVFNKI